MIALGRRDVFLCGAGNKCPVVCYITHKHRRACPHRWSRGERTLGPERLRQLLACLFLSLPAYWHSPPLARTLPQLGLLLGFLARFSPPFFFGFPLLPPFSFL